MFKVPHGQYAEEDVIHTHIKIGGVNRSIDIFPAKSNSGKSFVSNIIFNTPEGTETIHTVGKKIKK